MAHPKVVQTMALADAAKLKAFQARNCAERMDDLESWLSSLSVLATVGRLELTNGMAYQVPYAAREAIGVILQDAYKAELSELREKLEAL